MSLRHTAPKSFNEPSLPLFGSIPLDAQLHMRLCDPFGAREQFQAIRALRRAGNGKRAFNRVMQDSADGTFDTVVRFRTCRDIDDAS